MAANAGNSNHPISPMHFSILLSLLALLSLGEMSANSVSQVPRADWLWTICIGVALGTRFVASELSAQILRETNQDHGRKLFDWLKNSFERLWPPTSVLLVWLSGWHLAYPLESDFPFCLLNTCLLLAPMLLPLMLGWLWLADVEQALSQGAQERLTSRERWRNRGSYLLLHIRHYLLVLIPVLIVISASGLKTMTGTATEQTVLMLIALATFIVTFPRLLRFAWGAKPLPDSALRERLERCVGRWNYSVKRICVWPTSGRVTNALVAGIPPLPTQLLLSDGLLEDLSEEMTEAIVLHELAHVRLQHSAWRLVVLGLPVYFALWTPTRLMSSFDPTVWWIVLSLFAIYLATCFAWYCRQLELEADAWAAAQLERATNNAREFLSLALTRIADVSGTPHDQSTWLHPSINERLASLEVGESAVAWLPSSRFLIAGILLAVPCCRLLAEWL